jgi:hypothetical protein
MASVRLHAVIYIYIYVPLNAGRSLFVSGVFIVPASGVSLICGASDDIGNMI